MTSLYAAVLGADGAAAPNAPGLLRRVRQQDAAFTIDTSEEVGLVLSLSEAHRVERRMAGRTSREVPRVGAVTLLTPGAPARFTITGSSRVLMLRLPWQRLTGWLAEDHEADPDRIELQPRLHADDPALARLLYGMATAGEDVDEAAARAVATRLLAGHAARPPTSPKPARGGLPPARLRRVLDRIEAQLSGPLPLGALAAEAGLSPFHFAREFQRATGTAPHQHLIRRRVDRAVVLLARPRLSVADVARCSGFAHASHLSRHMRRLTGFAPEAFRTRVLP